MEHFRHQISSLAGRDNEEIALNLDVDFFGSSEPVEVLSELGAVLVVELSSDSWELRTASAVFNSELESNPFELTADILDEAAVEDELADSAEVLLDSIVESAVLNSTCSILSFFYPCGFAESNFSNGTGKT